MLRPFSIISRGACDFYMFESDQTSNNIAIDLIELKIEIKNTMHTLIDPFTRISYCAYIMIDAESLHSQTYKNLTLMSNQNQVEDENLTKIMK
jgi:hypothetical protein